MTTHRPPQPNGTPIRPRWLLLIALVCTIAALFVAMLFDDTADAQDVSSCTPAGVDDGPDPGTVEADTATGCTPPVLVCEPRTAGDGRTVWAVFEVAEPDDDDVLCDTIDCPPVPDGHEALPGIDDDVALDYSDEHGTAIGRLECLPTQPAPTTTVPLELPEPDVGSSLTIERELPAEPEPEPELEPAPLSFTG